MICSAFANKYASAIMRKPSPARPLGLTKRGCGVSRNEARRRPLSPLNVKRRTDDRGVTPTADSVVTEEPVIESVFRETSTEEKIPERSAKEHYYETTPSAPPQFPVWPPIAVEASSGLPPWVWIMVGVLLGTVFNRIMGFVTRPKEAMAEIMMKQMMKQMGNPTSPFTPPNASPFGTPPAYDTTAKPSPPPPPPVSPFQPPATPPPANPQMNGSTKAKKTEQPPPPQSSFFQDVSAEGSFSGAPHAPESDIEPDEAVDFMFEMLKNPQMRDSLYQFLPENMRNPETLETVMASPMVKEQFKSMMTPALMQQIKGFRQQVDSPEIKNQLESMNVSPDLLMQKLMAEPEVMAMMQKPNVMQAVMDLQQNPSNVSKYMNDPEVMKFMMKMNELTIQAQVQSQEAPQQSPVSPPDAVVETETTPSVAAEPAPTSSTKIDP